MENLLNVENLKIFLQKIILVAVIVVIATVLKVILNLIVSKIFDRKMKKYIDKSRRFMLFKKLLTGAVNALYFVVVTIIILDAVGLGGVITALITFAGVGSLVIGLAAQNIFKDLIAGFILITEDKLNFDDWVKLNNDVEGTVEKITLRNVYIRTYGGQLVIIPCGQINIVENYARGKAKAICEIKLPYSEKISDVKEIILKAGHKLKENNTFVKSVPTVAGVTSLVDGGYTVRVFVETDGLEFWAVSRALNEYVVEELQSYNIQIVVPTVISNQSLQIQSN